MASFAKKTKEFVKEKVENASGIFSMINKNRSKILKTLSFLTLFVSPAQALGDSFHQHFDSSTDSQKVKFLKNQNSQAKTALVYENGQRFEVTYQIAGGKVVELSRTPISEGFLVFDKETGTYKSETKSYEEYHGAKFSKEKTQSLWVKDSNGKKIDVLTKENLTTAKFYPDQVTRIPVGNSYYIGVKVEVDGRVGFASKNYLNFFQVEKKAENKIFTGEQPEDLTSTAFTPEESTEITKIVSQIQEQAEAPVEEITEEKKENSGIQALQIAQEEAYKYTWSYNHFLRKEKESRDLLLSSVSRERKEEAVLLLQEAKEELSGDLPEISKKLKKKLGEDYQDFESDLLDVEFNSNLFYKKILKTLEPIKPKEEKEQEKEENLPEAKSFFSISKEKFLEFTSSFKNTPKLVSNYVSKAERVFENQLSKLSEELESGELKLWKERIEKAHGSTEIAVSNYLEQISEKLSTELEKFKTKVFEKIAYWKGATLKMFDKEISKKLPENISEKTAIELQKAKSDLELELSVLESKFKDSYGKNGDFSIPFFIEAVKNPKNAEEVAKIVDGEFTKIRKKKQEEFLHGDLGKSIQEDRDNQWSLLKEEKAKKEVLKIKNSKFLSVVPKRFREELQEILNSKTPYASLMKLYEKNQILVNRVNKSSFDNLLKNFVKKSLEKIKIQELKEKVSIDSPEFQKQRELQQVPEYRELKRDFEITVGLANNFLYSILNPYEKSRLNADGKLKKLLQSPSVPTKDISSYISENLDKFAKTRQEKLVFNYKMERYLKARKEMNQLFTNGSLQENPEEFFKNYRDLKIKEFNLPTSLFTKKGKLGLFSDALKSIRLSVEMDEKGYVGRYTKAKRKQVREHFLRKGLEFSKLIEKEFNVFGDVALAQSFLETRKGTSWLALNARNYFGIRSTGKSDSYDFVKRKDLDKNGNEEIAKFRIHCSMIDSYTDYGRLIKEGSWNNGKTFIYGNAHPYRPYLEDGVTPNPNANKEKFIEALGEIYSPVKVKNIKNKYSNKVKKVLRNEIASLETNYQKVSSLSEIQDGLAGKIRVAAAY